MNNSHNKSNLDNEIDVIYLIDSLIKSYKMIIFITLFCSFASGIYAYSLKSTYQSLMGIKTGYFINIDGKNLDEKILISEFNFLNKLIVSSRITRDVIEFKTKPQLSKSEAEDLLKKASASIISTADKSIETKVDAYRNKLKESLKNIDKQIEHRISQLESISNELDRLSNLDKSLNSASGIENTISRLIRQRDEEIRLKKNLDRDRKDAVSRISDSLDENIFPTKVIKEIETIENKPRRGLFFIAASVLGFFLSILFVLLKAGYNSRRK